MDGSATPADAPAPEELGSAFRVYQVRRDGDRLLYVGDPVVAPDAVERRLWDRFRERGYEITLRREYVPRSDGTVPTHGWVLVAEPRSIGVDGIPWTNVILALVTMGSTLFVGAVQWYHIDPSNPLALLEAWPFAAAVLGVLAVHELGHYVASRYHGVDASLPYFIPFPTLIGTMGAVIRMKGRIPDRRALFDIGASGPLAGLVATVVVSAIGLQLDPLAAQQVAPTDPNAVVVRFHHPLLLQAIAVATGTLGKLEAGTYHPVVFGGWVGMFITFLNLLPVGQLDGGHIVRAVLGERQETVAAAVPAALFGLAGYLYFLKDTTDSIGIWVMWGLLAMGLAYAGPATPVQDYELDAKRRALALLTFLLGLLCFTPVPFEIVA